MAQQGGRKRNSLISDNFKEIKTVREKEKEEKESHTIKIAILKMKGTLILYENCY